MTGRLARAVKRGTDILVSGLVLLAVAPLLLATALAVRLGLGRPVLFRQPRVGRDGALFVLRKFRTMRDARDAQGRPLPDAQRTPAVGRLLRRARLDELPQLWHVLIGDMSLIGPRPLVPAEVAVMGEGARERAAVRPGITGWAQVHGGDLLGHDHHDVQGIEAKLALDLWYVRHAGLATDLRIIVLTVRMIVQGERICWDVIEAARAALATT